MKSLVRSFLGLAVVATLGLLVGCGGGSSSTPSGLPLSVSLTTTATTIQAGQSADLTATVANDNSGEGVTWSLSGPGTLSNETNAFVTYNAPNTVTGTQTPTITATSVANTSVSGNGQITVVFGISFLSTSQTINAGTGTTNITAKVVGDSSGAGVNWGLTGPGSLANQTATSVTYNAPSSVTTNALAYVTATAGANSASTSQARVAVLPGTAATNVQYMTVDGGVVASNIYPNGGFTSVTVCTPGSTTNCTTVDGILVDTGSVGLRILASSLNGLAFTPITSGSGTLNNCVAFVDGSFLWGEVALADVHLNGLAPSTGEVASSLPVQLVADPTSFAIPSTCNNGGIDEDNQIGLGANGIIGVGPEPTDCTFGGQNFCTGAPPQGDPYYFCSGSSCVAASVPTTQQVTNPIVGFTSTGDDNGLAILFEPVTDGEPTVTGTMIFGIGTQTNNPLGTATVYTMNSSDEFTTNYSGQVLTQSFIDSGSNAYFFPDSTIPVCTDFTSFFCPTSTLPLSAVNVGVTQGSGTVSFSVANTDTLFNSSNPAYGDLAGPNGTPGCTGNQGACSFDWGLPFFFRGTPVFTSIDGQGVPTGQPTAPWWAY
jgi:hypothetical protein